MCLKNSAGNTEEFPSYIPLVAQTSFYKESIIADIDGFICRNLCNKLSCEICAKALFANDTCELQFYHMLIQQKYNGGLIYPSSDVIKVLKVAENVFEQYVDIRTSSKFLRSLMKACVMRMLLSENIFNILHESTISRCITHSTQISKTIVEEYLNLSIWTRCQRKYQKAKTHKIDFIQRVVKTLVSLLQSVSRVATSHCYGQSAGWPQVIVTVSQQGGHKSLLRSVSRVATSHCYSQSAGWPQVIVTVSQQGGHKSLLRSVSRVATSHCYGQSAGWPQVIVTVSQQGGHKSLLRSVSRVATSHCYSQSAGWPQVLIFLNFLILT